MRAVSIHQPWAWAILNAGKDVENRSWRTHHRGPILIHASATRSTYDREANRFSQRFRIALPPWEELHTRALIGIVDIVGCVRDSTSRWAEPDSWHWLLENPRTLSEPLACRGAQLLFHVPEAMYLLTREMLGE